MSVDADSRHDPLLVKLFSEALGRQSQGGLSSALAIYKRIQRQFPYFADAWINASSALREMGRHEEALDAALRAIELAPENPIANFALADAHQCLENINKAAACFRKTLEYDPGHLPALANLARIYVNNGYFAQAVELCDRAIKLEPSKSVIWMLRGQARYFLLDISGAEADMAQAIALDANNWLAYAFLACFQRIQWRYQESWATIKACRDLGGTWVTRQDFGKPHWNGEPLNGRTLLVYKEQHGFGDYMQLARFFPYMRRQYGCRILLLIHEPLARLFADLSGIDGLIIRGEPTPDFDVVSHVGEFFLIINIDPSKLPPPITILPGPRPMPELERPGFKIGLVWDGSPLYAGNAFRSISPQLFNDLADMPGIAWYGLQKPPGADLPNLPGFIDMSPHIGDFMDTAQIAKQLDLIVTVDTSMAHLAGSLGLPTIVMLPHPPDWRWGLNSQHSPWYPYPDYLLIRQPVSGEWKGAVDLLRDRIAELMDGIAVALRL